MEQKTARSPRLSRHSWSFLFTFINEKRKKFITRQKVIPSFIIVLHFSYLIFSVIRLCCHNFSYCILLLNCYNWALLFLFVVAELTIICTLYVFYSVFNLPLLRGSNIEHFTFYCFFLYGAFLKAPCIRCFFVFIQNRRFSNIAYARYEC